jgi:lysophospholipase L1-like esterase
MRILFFGDSITQGFTDSEGGWADRIKRYYAKNTSELVKDVGVMNLGISGDTSEGLKKRIESEISVRTEEELIVVIAIGTNDTIYQKDSILPEPTKYIENLHSIKDKASKFTDKIMFVGLTPVIDELLQPIKWSRTGKCYSTQVMNQFNEAIKEFCNNENLTFVSLWEAFENKSLESLMSDGLHPNDSGHLIIKNLVLEALLK